MRLIRRRGRAVAMPGTKNSRVLCLGVGVVRFLLLLLLCFGLLSFALCWLSFAFACFRFLLFLRLFPSLSRYFSSVWLYRVDIPRVFRQRSRFLRAKYNKFSYFFFPSFFFFFFSSCVSVCVGVRMCVCVLLTFPRLKGERDFTIVP